jgi:ankyrin repeat protein
MMAVHYDKLEIFRYLTEIAAEINIRNTNNKTAPHMTAGSGILDIIELLLDESIAANLTDTDGNTPLHICAQFGHLE